MEIFGSCSLYFFFTISVALLRHIQLQQLLRSRRGDPDDIFMAVVFPTPFAPRKPKFLLYRPQNVINSGKAAKFLAEVSYFYDSFSSPERREFCWILLVS
jgi:hypothetical protein